MTSRGPWFYPMLLIALGFLFLVIREVRMSSKRTWDRQDLADLLIVVLILAVLFLIGR